MESGYFFCGDILGFSKIVENLSQDQLDKKIEEWVSIVEAAANRYKIERFQLISDTVFAVVGENKEQLKSLISFARELLSQGVGKSICIRGAITHGQFQWGNLVYGRAVIKAYQLEQEQNWIGVIVDLPNLVLQDYLDMHLILYPVPKKASLNIQSQAVISWDIPAFDELSKKMGSNGLSKKGEIMKWGFGEKLSNTILFRVYLKMAKKEKWAPDRYCGILPVQLVEIIVERHF